MNKINLRYDSRDQIFHQKFGQVLDFPDELNLDTPLYDDVQPVGNVQCTCYTTCDMAEDQTGIAYDIDDLWKRVPKYSDGADPRDVLGKAVSQKEDGGLLPKGESVRVKKWKSYWRGDLGIHDPFDNVRSTLLLARTPIGVGTFWYDEWFNQVILPIGKTASAAHMYNIEGWKQINGQPHFIIEAWLGRKILMPRETFNEAMKPLGMQTWVLSTSEIDAKRIKSLTEIIKDLMVNLIIKLRDMIKTYKVEPVVPAPSMPNAPYVPTALAEPVEEPVKHSLLLPWAKAIEIYEGANKSWNNPGAIRSKKGPFLKFKTYQEGWNYLLNYLTRAATGKHPAYKPTMTLLEFQKVYSPTSDNNNPQKYAEFVAKRIGVTINTQIKNLV